MKIFFLILIIIVLVGAGFVTVRYVNSSANTERLQAMPRRYIHPLYNYSINWPEDYKIEDVVPELVVIENDIVRIKVNYGCYDFGLENMTEYSEAVELNGKPALKQSYYSNFELQFKRVMVDMGTECISLEYWANEQRGWQDAEELIHSFRITE